MKNVGEEIRKVIKYFFTLKRFKMFNKKLSYRRVTARCVVSIEILLANCHATLQKLLIRQVLTKSMV